jgi:Retrotransposon gag protein
MATLTPNPVNPMFVPTPTIEIPINKVKTPAQGESGGGNGGPPTAANTMVMAPVKRPNRGSLRGNPPKVFNGTHSKSNKFLQEFRLYYLTNCRTEVIKSLVEWVALALSYIWGPNVNDWVEHTMNQMLAMTTHHNAPINQNNEDLWRTFKRDFWRAFTDTARTQNAQHKLMALKMKNANLDGYIAKFDHLSLEAGWEPNAKGITILFCKGLTPSLHCAILEKVQPWPVTMIKWQDAMCSQHKLWAKVKSALRFKRNWHWCWGQALGRKQGGGGFKPQRDPNVIDVDTAKINMMDEDKRKKLLAKRHCFYCEKQGHIAQTCFKKWNAAGAHAPTWGNGANHQGMATCTTNIKKKNSADELARKIQGLEEEKRELVLQKLMILGF